MDTFNPNQMPQVGIPEKKSHGPLIAVIIILVLIIVGGLYFLKERTMDQQTYIPPMQTTEEDAATASLKTQGSSDDLSSIEADLNASDFSNLDQGATALQAELQ